VLPNAYAELLAVRDTLERHYRDMQDIEFTVQQNKLYMLQTRSGKRTAAAALRIAIEMAQEGRISREEAIGRVTPSSLDQLLHPTLDPEAERTVIARPLPASPGGRPAPSCSRRKRSRAGPPAARRRSWCASRPARRTYTACTLARGVLTTRGGMTSHAAVVARGMGRVCVAGCGGIRVDYGAQTLSAGSHLLRAGDWITLDGSTGEVFAGRVATIEPTLSGDFATLMGWADAVRRLRVRANAETPEDAATAHRFGAEGIGLCRTEHMFFGPARISAVRQMIMAEDAAERRCALAILLPFQCHDFAALFRIMAGLPVTIRLLDPPLHEFLPHGEAEIAEVAAGLGKSVEALRQRGAALAESNPMLGHRGCRLGISFPEIYEMQARAIFEAAILVARENGRAVVPEIMIPLVGTARELELTRAEVERVARDVTGGAGMVIEYQVGTMIELPRAALTADQIAAHADFFSFGTNDLT
jgi:pyruvate,orthophosphate dikinase